MSGLSVRGSTHWRQRLLTLVFCISGVVLSGDRPAAAISPALDDATLTDLFFLTPELGWAVGDRGVIWHTSDGGRHWDLQNSGSDCRLESVQFIDAKRGWAAGGYTDPYTHVSHAVLLHTADGGQHWRPNPLPLIPRLVRLGFFNERQGWAIGEPSSVHPSGLFITEDSGRSWVPVVSDSIVQWRTGDFLNLDTGAVAGEQGRIASIRRRGVESSSIPTGGLRTLRHMTLAPDGSGWLVGDGNLIYRTADGGRSWQASPGELPEELGPEFNWQTVTTVGTHCWIAGNPGSKLLHSADGGQHWELLSTGQSAPLASLHFVDEQRGWAVGSLGTILRTDDGGRTWNRQRSGGTRAALLGIFARGEDVPLEVLSQLSAEEGYLSAITVLSNATLSGNEAQTTSPLELRLRDAVVASGGSHVEMAWQFPLVNRQLAMGGPQITELWDRVNDGQGVARLEAQLVQQIRQWRPEVVLTRLPAIENPDPAAELLSQLVIRAVQQAADPTRFSEQITRLGLEPWEPQKVIGVADDGRGTLQVVSNRVAPRLGRTLSEYTSRPRGLVARQFAVSPTTIGCRLLIDRLPQGRGQRDFFSGLSLQPGGEARRRLLEVPDVADQMRRTAQKHRNIEAILERTQHDQQTNLRMLAEIGNVVAELGEENATQLLFQLGEQYRGQGRWGLAAESYELLVSRWPRHPLAAQAMVWLIQYYSSAELGRLAGQDDPRAMRKTPAAGPRGGLTHLGQVGPEAPTEPVNERIEPVVETKIPLPADAAARYERAAELARQLEQLSPTLYAEPQVRFPLAVADRQRGFPRQADRYYLGVRHGRPQDAWWRCADAERWLAEPRTECVKERWKVQRCTSPPLLDGSLDEPCWQLAAKIPLVSPRGDDAEWPSVVLMCRDQEFLYLAASCRIAPGVHYELDPSPRTRDADLTGQDRIEILLDVDRDYCTYYRLTVDYRGRTAESCGGSLAWDPRWFVAAHNADGTWQFEAAIPLAELVETAPEVGAVWAAGAQRIIPSVGFQSWTRPAEPEPRGEAFGLLLME